MKTRSFLLLLVLCLTGCPRSSDPPPPPGPPPTDADPAACEGACTIIKLKCPNTKLAQDHDCATACKKVESSGYLTIHPGCISKSVTADDVRKCNFQCKE